MALSQAQTQHGVLFFLFFFLSNVSHWCDISQREIIGKILPAAEKLKELKEVMLFVCFFFKECVRSNNHNRDVSAVRLKLKHPCFIASH